MSTMRNRAPRRPLTLCGSLLLLAGCGGAGPPAPPAELRLENGLRVLLRPISGARQTALMVLFDVGANHDPKGQSGLGHLLEHVYVTAAAGKTPVRTAGAMMAGGGGNAQTGEDYTVVAEVFPPGELAARLRDAADRMGDLRVEESDLRREKPRLLAEVNNMFGAMPALGAFNRAREGLRPAPNGGRRGGLPAEVERIGVAAIRERWRRFYKPANARLILTGAFDPETVRADVESVFGKIPAGERATGPQGTGKPRVGRLEKLTVKSVSGPASEVTLVYPAPIPGSRDYAPFLLLAARLTGRLSSSGGGGMRFPPPVYFAPLDDPFVLSVSGSVRAGETPEQAGARLEASVEEALRPELSEADRAAAVNQFGPFLGLIDAPEAMWAQNPYGLALYLGRAAQLGLDPAKLRDEVNGVSGDDLRRCAASIFSPEHRAAATVTAN